MRAAYPLAFAVAAGAVLTGCGSSSSGSTTVAASEPAASPAATGAPPAATGTGAVLKIANYHYDPTPLTVTPGETVAVTNTDSPEHTVTSDMAGLFLGDDIKNGKTVTFKAPTAPGTYTFHCQYHSSMHGTLLVK